MAENCMKVSAANVANNPVIFTQDEIEEIYRKAMGFNLTIKINKYRKMGRFIICLIF